MMMNLTSPALERVQAEYQRHNGPLLRAFTDFALLPSAQNYRLLEDAMAEHQELFNACTTTWEAERAAK